MVPSKRVGSLPAAARACASNELCGFLPLDENDPLKEELREEALSPEACRSLIDSWIRKDRCADFGERGDSELDVRDATTEDPRNLPP